MNKVVANFGVARNKKPLQNIVLKVEIIPTEGWSDEKLEQYKPYLFKDLGYISLCWQYERDLHKSGWMISGRITAEKLKEKIGEKQWGKFCQGKREFVIQRRIDG